MVCAAKTFNLPIALFLVTMYTEREREKEHGTEEGDVFPIVRKLPIIHKGGVLES